MAAHADIDIDLEEGSSACAHSDKWWLDDGNIVLQAENTLFCVHRSMLSRQSSVFRDMFEVGDSGRSDAAEGRPLVHLSDLARELENFFTALWDWKSYFDAIAKDFDVFVDCLRMATKYDVQPLRQAAIVLLQDHYPRKFSDWGAADERLHVPKRAAFAVVQLVRELSLPSSMLPSAFYECCTEDVACIDDVFEGCTLPSGRRYRLGSDDLRACLKGYERLAIIERMELHGFHGFLVPNCQDPLRCSHQMNEDQANFDEDMHEIRGFDIDIFQDLEPSGYCSVCRKRLKEHNKSAQKRIWLQLPEIFGLGTWAELHAHGST